MLKKRNFRNFSLASGIIGKFYGEKASFSKMFRNWHNKKDILDKHFTQRQSTRPHSCPPADKETGSPLTDGVNLLYGKNSLLIGYLFFAPRFSENTITNLPSSMRFF